MLIMNKGIHFGRVLFRNLHSARRLYSSVATNEKPLILTEKAGKTFLIGINRPDKRNCINHEMAKSLVAAFETFEKDDGALTAVLYGVGGNFCAGYDLQQAATTGEKIIDLVLSQPNEFRLLGPTVMRFKKPVIAVVEGYAVAGGFELSLMCDIRIADETAKFGVFCRRFGVPLIDGGTVRLPKLIGLSRAMDMILTGREVDAKTAFEFGLANQLVGTGTAFERAVAYAKSLEKFPQICLNADRRSANYATYDAKDYNDAIRYEWKKGYPVVAQESIAGATRFTQGVGKHGSFDLNPKKPSSKS